MFFILGLSVFVYLLRQFGFDQIVENVRKAGWSLWYVIGVWCAIYILNTLAWKLALGDRGNGVQPVKLFMVTVSGFVLNYITPVVALGGEPYKVRALAGSMETSRSLSAVVLYRMVHLLGHMFLLLTGVIVALLTLQLPAGVNIALVCSGAAIGAVILITISGHRGGIFIRLKTFLARVPVLNRLATALEKYETSLHEMDETITNVYHHERKRLYLSVLLEYISRVCMGIEVYLILRGVGVETTIASALFIYVVYSIIINILFFIPLNIGAREGGLYLGLEALALPPLLGVYLGIVMRVREFFWIALGLLFILVTSRKERPASARV